MGGETEAQVSPWTVDSLKTFLLDKMEARDKHLDERKEAQERAVADALAEKDKRDSERAASMEKRLDGMNEFRQTLSDQSKTFLTRDSYDLAHGALESRVGTIENLITGLAAKEQGAKEQVTEKRQDNSSKIGLIVAVATVINVLFVLVANGVFR
jgi:hypothetical protein